MSPDAPGRTAYTGRGFAPGYTGVEVDQPVLGEWRRHDIAGHPSQLPQQLTVQIIRANLAMAGGHDLGSQVVLPHERRRPVLDLASLNPLDFLTRLRVKRGKKRGRGPLQERWSRPATLTRRRPSRRNTSPFSSTLDRRSVAFHSCHQLESALSKWVPHRVNAPTMLGIIDFGVPSS